MGAGGFAMGLPVALAIVWGLMLLMIRFRSRVFAQLFATRSTALFVLIPGVMALAIALFALAAKGGGQRRAEVPRVDSVAAIRQTADRTVVVLAGVVSPDLSKEYGEFVVFTDYGNPEVEALVAGNAQLSLSLADGAVQLANRSYRAIRWEAVWLRGVWPNEEYVFGLRRDAPVVVRGRAEAPERVTAELIFAGTHADYVAYELGRVAWHGWYAAAAGVTGLAWLVFVAVSYVRSRIAGSSGRIR
jgi:hypothetical protein